MTALKDDTLLLMRREFDAAPEDVFNAWLTHEEFQSWIGPEGINCDVPIFEPRVGGRYRFTMNLPDGSKRSVSGEFKSIDAPRSFSITWGWDAGDRHSLVTISLRAVGSKTELTLKQEGLGTVENRDAHNRGWTGALNKLAAYLAAN